MPRNGSTKTAELRQRRDAPLATPTDLTRSATKDITGAMNAVLADVVQERVAVKRRHRLGRQAHCLALRAEGGVAVERWCYGRVLANGLVRPRDIRPEPQRRPHARERLANMLKTIGES